MFSQNSPEDEKCADGAEDTHSASIKSIFSKKFTEEEQENFLNWKRLAEQGSAEAQLRTGLCYEEGNGVEQSYEKAIHYYELAADQGFSPSLETLGNCYENGEGVEQSNERAFQYYKMAADIDMKQGNGDAIFALARCYKLGIGTERSLENAIYYYKLAAENGFLPGYFEVGQCYRKLGGKENEEKAKIYFKMVENTLDREEEHIQIKENVSPSSVSNTSIEIQKSKSDEKNKPQIQIFTEEPDNSFTGFVPAAMCGFERLPTGAVAVIFQLLNSKTLETKAARIEDLAEKSKILSLIKYDHGLIQSIFMRQEWVKAIDSRGITELILSTGDRENFRVVKEDVDALSMSEEYYENFSKLCTSLINNKNEVENKHKPLKDMTVAGSNQACEQVYCRIADYFPGIEKGDDAVLTYLDEDVIGISGVPKKYLKVVQLYHLTCNVNLGEMLESGRLAVYVVADKGHHLYLTETAMESLKKRNVDTIAFPFFGSQEKLGEVFIGENNPTENACIFIDADRFHTFNKKQQESVLRISLAIYAIQIQLGWGNISRGGIFSKINDIENPEIVTVGGQNTEDNPIDFFYLSKDGLNLVGIDSCVLQLEMINSRNTGSMEEWKKRVEELFLIGFLQDKEGKKQVLLPRKALEDNPQWEEILNKSAQTTLTVKYEDKYIIYEPNVSVGYIDQETYENLAHQIESIIQEWFH